MRNFVKDLGRLREKYHRRGVLEVKFDGFYRVPRNRNLEEISIPI